MSRLLAQGESQQEDLELIPLRQSAGAMSTYSKQDSEETSRGTSFGSELESGSIRLRAASGESAANDRAEGSPDEFIDIQVCAPSVELG